VGNPGCGSISLVSLAPGAGQGTGQNIAVGTNPVGIGILPQAELAVVANSGSNTASIVDLVGATVVANVATDVGPTGVAIDPALTTAIVAATNANVADTFTVSTSPGTITAVSVQQRPVGVGVDTIRHLALVGNTTGNTALCGPSSSGTASLVDLTQHATTNSFCLNSPAGITYDPFMLDFLAALSLSNQVSIVDPTLQTNTALRVGVNPTSISDNFATSTMVTTNNLSNSMTVVDLPARQVRAVLPVTASNAFSVEIHPFTNLAVIADTTNNRLLLYPLPR
jgi:DNA-binding beta-propeller fold protein YncE